ncbi:MULTISPECIES: hypothetical protein [Methylorubrum]|uniref:hypothetical protein n=1 Tax=Methylorubrum TaxID=2282523 RepID=UPI00209CD198|nr:MULTISPECIES: hypothetical protein [Methylorubrum]MCP1550627.1 hypothetical protein [Methylorubrum zatmanii]MCP1552760.1 hypothetical protein [Methylorubrum extorquens]MCP1580930.1 hypothetical protein [Methylorubrum extorquens]
MRRAQVLRSAPRLGGGPTTTSLAGTAAFTRRIPPAALAGPISAVTPAALARPVSSVPSAALACAAAVGLPGLAVAALARLFGTGRATFAPATDTRLSTLAAARRATGCPAALAATGPTDIGAPTGTACAAGLARAAPCSAGRTATRAARASSASTGTACAHPGTSCASTTAAGPPGPNTAAAAAALSECGCRAQHQDRRRRRAAKEFRHVPSLFLLSDRLGAEAGDATANVAKPFPE